MATTQELLADAEAAYHKLMTGQAVASFRDQNGEQVSYTKANISALLAYITSLGGPTWIPQTGPKGPMSFYL